MSCSTPAWCTHGLTLKMNTWPADARAFSRPPFFFLWKSPWERGCSMVLSYVRSLTMRSSAIPRKSRIVLLGVPASRYALLRLHFRFVIIESTAEYLRWISPKSFPSTFAMVMSSGWAKAVSRFCSSVNTCASFNYQLHPSRNSNLLRPIYPLHSTQPAWIHPSVGESLQELCGSG